MEKIIIEGREAIIAEYLTGGTTYRKLGSKYGIDFRANHHWVSRFKGKQVKKVKLKIKPTDVLPKEELPTDVKQLQKELRKANLHNKLLNAIIDIGTVRSWSGLTFRCATFLSPPIPATAESQTLWRIFRFVKNMGKLTF